ncbi:MAG: TetR/AcrR family transcriptional regulator, partial [Anaerolineae bacterium]|nr:TetR/AcrR family transcriptional regulator [Anaerolineae bacterium]
MARLFKENEYTQKRNEILDSAQRLIYTRGYEAMTIQDILVDLNISSGAFYHYFKSKPAILQAFIERTEEQVEIVLCGIVENPHLSAIDKLQQYFNIFNQLRVDHKPLVVNMLATWYSDDNAIVRQKILDLLMLRRTPFLAKIISQGV